MIPEWNISGVIPPIRPGKSGNDPDRSPYLVTLSTLVDRFGSISKERREILRGLFLYREELHKIGVKSGVQWLDGSFMQDVEGQENRPPSDIDVVTYFYLPDDETQESLFQKNPELFDHNHVKSVYKVDAYFSVLGTCLTEYHLSSVSYWYSMWSHCRDTFTWKGFLQTVLDEQETKEALDILNSYEQGGMSND